MELNAKQIKRIKGHFNEDSLNDSIEVKKEYLKTNKDVLK